MIFLVFQTNFEISLIRLLPNCESLTPKNESSLLMPLSALKSSLGSSHIMYIISLCRVAFDVRTGTLMVSPDLESRMKIFIANLEQGVYRQAFFDPKDGGFGVDGRRGMGSAGRAEISGGAQSAVGMQSVGSMAGSTGGYSQTLTTRPRGERGFAVQPTPSPQPQGRSCGGCGKSGAN